MTVYDLIRALCECSPNAEVSFLIGNLKTTDCTIRERCFLNPALNTEVEITVS